MVKTIYIALTILIVALGILTVEVVTTPHAGSSMAGKTSVPLVLTDPPQVPSGTTALTIAYSGAQFYAVNASGSSMWINSSQSGTVDLMSLINLTQTISTLQVSSNSMIEKARFNIRGASITINGTTYPVTVVSHEITANVTGSSTVNSNSSILVDLSPTVVTIYTSNSTVFVMVPSVKAVFVPGNTSKTLPGGVLPPWCDVEMFVHCGPGNVIIPYTPNITITNASLSTNANITTISVTVKDNSNSSVRLNNLLVYGASSVNIYQCNGAVTCGYAVNGSATGNAQISTQVPPFSIASNSNVAGWVSGNAGTVNTVGGVVGSGNTGISSNPADLSTTLSGSADVGSNTSVGLVCNCPNVPYGAKTVSGPLPCRCPTPVYGTGNASVTAWSNGTTLAINANGGFATGVHAVSVPAVLVKQGYIISNLRTLNFIILANGTLALPSVTPCSCVPGIGVACPACIVANGCISTQPAMSTGTTSTVMPMQQNCDINYNSTGYVLQPGQSVTLTYTGAIGFGGYCTPPTGTINITTSQPNIPRPGRCPLNVGIVNGDNYRVVVTGSDGAQASIVVTAS